MNQQAMLTQLYAAWTVVRHLAFWAKWAFYTLFAAPSVMLCAALALYSGFSFSTIPREFYQYAADIAKYPAAQDGYLTVQTCNDLQANQLASAKESGATLPPAAICKTFGFSERPIEKLTLEASKYLWFGYVIAVFITAFLASMLGLFESSRRAFLASAGGTRPRSAKPAA
ncbi:hypothetical protein [Paraburkholderia aspalathi]|uniref:hypothetical protein n=1 Tax=Paraburkholderia aspalathi TaxID=1324617 RepID=UPI001B00E1E4|nr:hypothetical protein [Paraburkholderia aspalathi]CAE6842162.1 hypothetical protein R20943_07163 [Paraburkholderia aspalathi]